MIKKAIEDLAQTEKPHILVIGDVMLDRYLFCNVTGISPEDDLAPKLKVQSETWKPGGAANVFENLRAMGANTSLLGVVGDDAEALVLRRILDSASLISDPERRTTTKTRVITSRGRHVSRIDRENVWRIGGPLLHEAIYILRGWLKAHPGGIVVVSDYDKGMICPELVADVVASQRAYLVGAKQSDFSYYGPAKAILCNEFEHSRRTVEGKADVLVVTHGAKGCWIMRNDAAQGMVKIETNPREVGDPTGCGDAFLAAFSFAFASGWSIDDAARLGNAAGAITYDHVGVHSVTLLELKHELERFDY
jgi:D-beta-D-heptose 7-phosphate kinase/D-beta-D-heptose 1-phosphate adenosyltransferase